MLKDRLWLAQLPLVALFSFAFYVSELGTQGELKHPFLRDTLYPKLKVVTGWFTDRKFQIRGPVPPKNKVVIVAVDEESLVAYGRWPWHRDTMAHLIGRTLLFGANTVALDIVFAEPSTILSDNDRGSFEQQGKLPLLAEVERVLAYPDESLKTTIFGDSGKIIIGFSSSGSCVPRAEGAQCDPSKAVQTISMQNPTQVDYSEKFKVAQGLALSENQLKNFRPENRSNTLVPFVTQVDFNLYGISQVAESSGFFDANVDPDGVIRSTQLVKLTEAGFFPSLALAQASMILGEKPDVLFDGTGAVGTIRFNNKNLNVPVTPSGAAEINFRGRDQFVYLSAKDLLEATRPHEFEQRQNMLVELKQKLQTAQTEGNRSPASDELQKQVETLEKEQAVNRTKIERIQAALKDSAVIIGVTAIGAFDMRTFPYGSNIPGVEGHANILENILSGTLLEHGSSRLGTIVIFLLMTVGTLLFAYAAEKFEAVPALLLFVAVTLGLGFTDIKILFETYNQNWNTGFFTLEVLTVFVLTLALKYVTEEKNKKFVKGAFAKYVSPSIIDDIMADPTKLRVGGERRDLTIVFSDIRSFTSFSENMEATRLAKFLNDYLGLMTEIVFECQGTLDKYIGDAVMAFWGAPTPQPGHAGNAIRAAIRMQQVLNEHHARYQSQYGVDVQVGIGINSGPVNVGNMGSERIFEYTVIGDHVNLASRVEGLTKTYGVKILATRFTLDEMEKFGEVPPAHRSLDFVKVKGKKQAVELIQIFEKEPSPLALARFGKGRNHYARQEWDLAIEEFQITKNLMGGSDGPSQMYIERCEEFKKNPPELDWHGEWEMHSK